MYIPKNLIPLILRLETYAFNVFGNLNQGRLEETAYSLSLVKELANTHSGLWIGVQQALVSLLYGRRYALHLAELIIPLEAAIEHLKDKRSKVVRIDRMRRVLLYDFPASF